MLTWFGVAVAFIAALALTPVAIRLAKNTISLIFLMPVRCIRKPCHGWADCYLRCICFGCFSSWRLYAAGSCAADCRQYCNAYWSGRAILKSISPKVKLLGQVVASLVLVRAGYYVEFITNPFDGSIISLGF